MNKQYVLKEIRIYTITMFQKDVTGHDEEHMKRVAYWARILAKKEGADPFLCETAAWLHDIGDAKLFSNPDEAAAERTQLLRTLNFTNDEINIIDEAIGSVSFSKDKTPSTLIGKVVQDADRLDALGAVGIARTFAFGGAHNQAIYKERQDTGHSIGHFHEKLLKLKNLMNTDSGKAEAEHRHQFMLHFLKEFEREQHVHKSKKENNHGKK